MSKVKNLQATDLVDIQQPSVEQRRKGNKELLKAFEKFEIGVFSYIGTSGNIQNVLFSNFERGEDGHYTFTEGLFGERTYLNDVISAPMLLARLVSAGCAVQVEGQDGYKVTWIITLKHKKTEKLVTFYDYKGGSSIGGNETSNKDYVKDVTALVMALVNNDFPHPYDGCVVGEIA